MKPILARPICSFLLLFLATTSQSFATGEAGKDGVDFKAYGNNPNWQLEINNNKNKIKFTTGDATFSSRYPALGPVLYREAKKTVYRVPGKDHAMTVVILGKYCQDNVTGEAHEVMVTVVYDGEMYAGCGNKLDGLNYE